jgi:hypothetical protein
VIYPPIPPSFNSHTVNANTRKRMKILSVSWDVYRSSSCIACKKSLSVIVEVGDLFPLSKLVVARRKQPSTLSKNLVFVISSSSGCWRLTVRFHGSKIYTHQDSSMESSVLQRRRSVIRHRAAARISISDVARPGFAHSCREEQKSSNLMKHMPVHRALPLANKEWHIDGSDTSRSRNFDSAAI